MPLWLVAHFWAKTALSTLRFVAQLEAPPDGLRRTQEQPLTVCDILLCRALHGCWRLGLALRREEAGSEVASTPADKYSPPDQIPSAGLPNSSLIWPAGVWNKFKIVPWSDFGQIL